MDNFCTPTLRETIRSFGISDPYLDWLEAVSRNSPIPSYDGKDPRVRHLELPVKNCDIAKVWTSLMTISGYYFGISARKCGFNQQTVILVKYKEAKEPIAIGAV